MIGDGELFATVWVILTRIRIPLWQPRLAYVDPGMHRDEGEQSKPEEGLLHRVSRCRGGKLSCDKLSIPRRQSNGAARRLNREKHVAPSDQLLSAPQINLNVSDPQRPSLSTPEMEALRNGCPDSCRTIHLAHRMLTGAMKEAIDS